jgi:hypothetical protein
MPTKSATKKQQLEAIMGEKLGDDAIELIQFVLPVALSTRMPSITTHRHQLIGTPNVCYQNNTLDVSGYATTGSNGQSVFRLTRFICSSGELFNFPINVVATPFSSKPFFLTVMHTIVSNGQDVEIKVFAWDPNGAAAPSITFNWRCRVELPLIIL